MRVAECYICATITNDIYKANDVYICSRCLRTHLPDAEERIKRSDHTRSPQDAGRTSRPTSSDEVRLPNTKKRNRKTKGKQEPTLNAPDWEMALEEWDIEDTQPYGYPILPSTSDDEEDTD